MKVTVRPTLAGSPQCAKGGAGLAREATAAPAEVEDRNDGPSIGGLPGDPATAAAAGSALVVEA